MGDKVKNTSAFLFTDSFKEELTTLKKINQIGKRLSLTSEYYMYQGMLFALDKENPHVSLAFLDPKMINVLSPLFPHKVQINGNELYKYISNGKFIRHEEEEYGLYLVFEVEKTIKEEFEIEKFVNYAKTRNFTDFDIIVAYKKGWETNMQIYDLYLKYIKTLKEYTKLVEEYILLKYVDMPKPFEKCVSIINAIVSGENKFIGEKIFNDDEIKQLSESELPLDIHISDSKKDITYYVRLMKNMALTFGSGSRLSIALYKNPLNIYLYCVTKVETENVVVCNIFKVLNIINF